MFSRMAMNSISGVMMPCLRIPKLCDGMAFARTERPAAIARKSRKFNQPVLLRLAGEFGVLAGEIAVVHRLHFASVVFFHVTALQNPFAAQRGQPFIGRAGEIRIAPRPGAVIDAHGSIRLDSAGVGFGRRHFDFAHRHADVGVNFARHEDLAAVRQLFAAVRLERFFGRDHKINFAPWIWRLGSGDAESILNSDNAFEERWPWWPSARSFLRQHYLDQVQRVSSAPAPPSQPLSRRAEQVGSPNIV